MYKFTIRGARGSMPVSGREFNKYGGNTTCFSLATPQEMIIFDAGTGIISVGAELMKQRRLPGVTILFTHFHLDHVMALPFFGPLYHKSCQLTFMADPHRKDNWKSTLKTFMGRPYWPVELSECRAHLHYVDLPEGREGIDIAGVRIRWCPVWHPQMCLSYRLDLPKTSIVIATDREYGIKPMDEQFLEFCRGADIMIYDAQYTMREYPRHYGWGHGTWREGVEIAKEAGIRELVLTHHDPTRTDNQLDKIVAEARRKFKNVRAACENLVLHDT
ncbi:MAG: MBL fold metallo-hydrolase [Lentisphaerae bacterium]|nr:MBL fold metallo-hydrolase [Lentisphaerota bacterium]